MTNDDVNSFMSLGQVAELVGASKSATRAWLETDQVPAYVFGHGPNAALRYRRADIDAWVDDSELGDENDDEDDDDDETEEDGQEDEDEEGAEEVGPEDEHELAEEVGELEETDEAEDHDDEDDED